MPVGSADACQYFMNKLSKQIYLLPVKHEFQWDNGLLKTNELNILITKIIDKTSIDLIGEEFSNEALRGLPNNTEATIAQIIAKKLNVKHEFCDPDTDMRIRIRYPTKEQMIKKFGLKSSLEGTSEYKKRKEYEKTFWPVREKYWLDKIQNTNARNIIFLCGSSHFQSFKSLLTENKYIVKVIKI